MAHEIAPKRSLTLAEAQAMLDDFNRRHPQIHSYVNSAKEHNR